MGAASSRSARLSGTSDSDCQYSGRKALATSAAYVVRDLAYAPSTLSVAAIDWVASIGWPSSFCPMRTKARPLQLISVPDSGGPDAWDASDEEGSAMLTWRSTPASARYTMAALLRMPNGSPPLNTLTPRPSQKLRKL